MYELQRAMDLLKAGSYTCVLCGDGHTIADNRRGIRPLLELLDSGKDFSDYAAADKVVGKAAAFLYCLLGIRALYAGILSQPALEVLEQAGIPVEYGSLVPAIRNRTGDGFCPMETAVREITAPADAPEAIRKALQRLS